MAGVIAGASIVGNIGSGGGGGSVVGVTGTAPIVVTNTDPTNPIVNMTNQGTTTTLLHGNAAGNPSFAAVALGADVSGTLPISHGGTNSTTALSGSSIAISNGTALVQGAAGTTTTLLHGNASGAPTYSAAVLTTDVSGVLPVANGGTNSSAGLSNNRIMQSSGGAVVEASAITASRALKSDVNGIPVASTATAASIDALSGTNTGDQTITLTGNVTGSGTGSFAATIANAAVTAAMLATSAVDVSTTVVTGTLAAGRFPALTGNVTTSAGSLTTTIASGAVSSAMIASGAAATNVGTLAGDIVGTLPNPTLKTASAISTAVTLSSAITYKASVTPGALAIDWATGNTFSKTISGNSTFTFSNATDGQTIVFQLTTTGAFTATFPTAKWPAGTQPVQTATGTDVYTFIKIGSTVYANVVQAMA